MASVLTLCSFFANPIVSTVKSRYRTRTYKTSAIDSVSTEIAAHLDPTSGIDKTWRRNASLAWLEFTFKSSSTPFATESSASDVEKYPRVAAIVKYLQEFGDATTAFSDLRPYVELSQKEERNKLLDILRKGIQFGKNAKKDDLDSQFTALSVTKNEVCYPLKFQSAYDILTSDIVRERKRYD